jgi:MFS family permease
MPGRDKEAPVRPQRVVAVLASNPDVQPAADLHGRWLLLARISWWGLALLSLTFFMSGLPERYEALTLHWFIINPAPPAVVQEGLDQLGLTPGLYAGYGLALYVARATVFYLAAGLLFWRRPGERLALLVSCLLLALPVGDEDPAVLHAMAADEPLRAVIGKLVETVGFTLVLWLVFLFPDGRFRARWTRAVAIVWLLAGVGTLFLPGSPIDMSSWPTALAAAFIPACAVLAVAAQVWRYRHISSLVERQQTKWFALGLAIVLTEFAIGSELTNYAPLAWPAAAPSRLVLTDLILHTVHNLAFLAIPLTLAIAVLRHHLWDIDRLINRTLVYLILTIGLLGVYLVLVLMLGGMMRAVTGQNSSVVTAASTLVVAALFRPVRTLVQSHVDRRFNRRKYDAARTIEAFSARLRDLTELATLDQELRGVVTETMQPASVSLWMRPRNHLDRVEGRIASQADA